MINKTLPTDPMQPYVHAHSYKCICWTAIIAGALVAVGLGFLLNLFGIAIGINAITNDNNTDKIAIGGFIALVIGVIVSMIAAGYTAGYIGRTYSRTNRGIMYGFITWTLALLLSAIIISPLAHYTAAYTEALSNKQVNMESYSNDDQTQDDQNNKDEKYNSDNTTSEQAKELTPAAYLVFLLFFIGAISTCVGAYWAMNCKREDRLE